MQAAERWRRLPEPPTSTGRATPILDIDVRDEAGALGVGERGEIYSKGPNLIRGYWNRPDATAETIVDVAPHR